MWAEFAGRNIMQVERYHYFPPSPDRSAPPTASLLRQRRDETVHEGQLSRVLDVLKEVHHRFYDDDAPSAGGDAPRPPRDIRSVLAAMRQETLQGCVVVFSKVRSHSAPPIVQLVAFTTPSPSLLSSPLVGFVFLR